MTCKELIELLKQYPEGMEVITTRYSDYEEIKRDDWDVVQVVKKRDYFMRVFKNHLDTMSQEDRDNIKECLHLLGN